MTDEGNKKHIHLFFAQNTFQWIEVSKYTFKYIVESKSRFLGLHNITAKPNSIKFYAIQVKKYATQNDYLSYSLFGCIKYASIHIHTRFNLASWKVAFRVEKLTIFSLITIVLHFKASTKLKHPFTSAAPTLHLNWKFNAIYLALYVNWILLHITNTKLYYIACTLFLPTVYCNWLINGYCKR